MSRSRLVVLAVLLVVALGLGVAGVLGVGARSLDDEAVSVREGSPGGVGVIGGGPRSGK
ncbi:MAG: hypothetical protein AAGF99_15030 [Bacteroidota bacterium]